MKVKVENSCALIIDIQERLLPHISENETLILKVNKLIQGLKVLEIPIFVTEQYTKGLGFTADTIKAELGNEYLPDEKMSFSCCGCGDFMSKLKNSGKKFIIIAGIESHVCVLQTVLDLIDEGYMPVLIEDCVSSRSILDKNIAIKRMIHSGAIISSMESILFELTVTSGTDKFKQISKIVK